MARLLAFLSLFVLFTIAIAVREKRQISFGGASSSSGSRRSSSSSGSRNNGNRFNSGSSSGGRRPSSSGRQPSNQNSGSFEFISPSNSNNGINFGSSGSSGSSDFNSAQSIQDILGDDAPSINTDIGTRFNFNGNNDKKLGATCTTPEGKSGTCSYIFNPQCGDVLQAIRQGITFNLIRYLTAAIRAPCGFQGFDFTLCCASQFQNPITPAPTPKPTTPKPTTQPPTAPPQ